MESYANPSVDWLIISPHQVDTSISEAADALVDAAFTAIGIGSNLNIRTLDGSRAQREFAVYNSSAFCDCSYITDYAKGNAEGLYGDTIHFNAKGQDYKRSHLFAQTNLGWILGASQSFPAIRMGPVLLTSSNARSSVSSLIAYTGSSTNTVLAGITGSNLRAGDAINPEQSGMEFGWVSTNYGRIRSYNAGGSNSNGLDITYNGTGISLRPSVTASSQNGTTALPWETTVTQGLVLAPIAQTATTAAVSTVYTTTALTTTAPAQAITLANGTVGQIKTIMHVASSGSGTAVLTPTTKTGFTTITFTNIGDTATLQYFTTQGWMIIAIRGAVAA